MELRVAATTNEKSRPPI